MAESEQASVADEGAPRYPIVLVECEPAQSDALIGRLTLLGADAIEERDASTLVKGGPRGVTLSASFATWEEAQQARDELAGDGVEVRLEALVGDDWRDGWREHWKPTRLGERVVVVPSWVSYEPVAGDVVLKLDPGRAFGTGQHASTALACAALERALAGESPAGLVLDVGCGSGILSFAALLLGCARAECSDVDPEAIEVANENAAALGLTERVRCAVGSAEAVRGPAPLVVANIETPILVPLAPALTALVAEGGRLVLSGVLATQRAELVAAYEATGLRLDRCDERDGWIAPEFVRATP